MFEKITTVVINYQTPDLLTTAVESFRLFYPNVPLLLVDNGSKDQSRNTIDTLISQYPLNTSKLLLSNNIFHGPAMHMAIEATKTEFVFFLDSDTKTYKGGFLEKMIDAMQSSPKMYAIGKSDLMNKRGFISAKGDIVSVRTAYMLLRSSYYDKFHPFEHHGQPTLKNFEDANRLGFGFNNFPIQDYIEHFGRGTASRFGYQLGIKSKIDFVLNKLGL